MTFLSNSGVWPLLAAPFVGSVAGVLVRRLPMDRPVILARSCCETCGTPLGALDLVPLVSFVAARGRCRHCGRPIAWFHPAIELCAVAVALWAVLAEPDPTRIAGDCVLGWTLLALAWIDAEHFWLPDALTLPLLLAGLLEAFARAPDLLADRSLGALIGWFGLLALARAYRALRGREGIGDGDAKLLGGGGAWLGWASLPAVLLIAALAGLGFATFQAARGRTVQGTTALPFGPCLALAIWVWRLHGGH